MRHDMVDGFLVVLSGILLVVLMSMSFRVALDITYRVRNLGNRVSTSEGTGTVVGTSYGLFAPSRLSVRLDGDRDNAERTFTETEVTEVTK